MNKFVRQYIFFTRSIWNVAFHLLDIHCSLKNMLRLVSIFFSCSICKVSSETDVYLPEYGTITGNGYTNYREYLGIPYAKAPTPENNLRWQNTAKMDSWENNGSYAATSYGNGCLQSGFDGSEDCLYMNIWVPIDSSSSTSTGSTGYTTNYDSSDSGDMTSDSDEDSGLSVMIWFYGGAYLRGSAGSFYDGSIMTSQNNVIVVAFNYRLGALGFFYDQTLGFTGNYGYYDQLFAVNWVYDNIEYFGGNKNDITLFGHSAGAQSVVNMLLNYDAPSQTGISVKGKFRAAIMQSTPFSVPQRTAQTWLQVNPKSLRRG